MLTIDYSRLPHGTRLLDLGCGAGRHSFEGLRRGYEVVSVDIDGAVLKDVKGMVAAMAAEGQTKTRGFCVNASTLALPFSDGVFDVVIASEMLEHIEDDVSALREIERVLKPGGTAAVSVPRRWPERVCWALSDDYRSASGGHVRIYTGNQLKERLERVGLVPAGSHHAHALHTPYWWLKCVLGVSRDDARLPDLYHRFLVWDIKTAFPPVRLLERALNPVMGKSLVVYAYKRGSADA